MLEFDIYPKINISNIFIIFFPLNIIILFINYILTSIINLFYQRLNNLTKILNGTSSHKRW